MLGNNVFEPQGINNVCFHAVLAHMIITPDFFRTVQRISMMTSQISYYILRTYHSFLRQTKK